jgi:hypothetical protein
MDERPEIEDCVTMAQFNELRQTYKKEQMDWQMICKIFYSGFNIFLMLLKIPVTMKMMLRKP